jgi:toxin-antitoxin system PIN domain toxin
VTRFLLDVNVLVAMHIPENRDHERAQKWFFESGSDCFATCAITEAGFVRVSSQLSVKNGPIDFREFRIALESLWSLHGHLYWPMNISYLAATEPFGPRMHGPKQVTDAFLLGLARHHGGKLATLDRATLHVAGPEHSGLVEIIS